MHPSLLLLLAVPYTLAAYDYHATRSGPTKFRYGVRSDSCANRCTETELSGTCGCSLICESPMFRSACCHDYERTCLKKRRSSDVMNANGLTFVEANANHPFASEMYPFNMNDENRPTCKDENYHALPQDCNKFYRCVDSYKMKIYRTFYFSCPDGMMFNSRNQTCLLGVDVTEDDCMADPTPKPTTGTIPTIGTITSTETTTPTETTTETATTTPEPTTTEIITTTPEPDIITPPPCDDCYLTMNFCSEYDVCTAEYNNEKMLMELCSEAYEECFCTDPIQVTDLCKEGQYYYNFETVGNKCFDNPNATSMSCEPSSFCKAVDEIPVDQPRLDNACKEFSICSNNLQFRGVVEYCKHYFKCDQNLELEKFTCTGSQYFSFDSSSCVDLPVDNLCSDLLPTRLFAFGG